MPKPDLIARAAVMKAIRNIKESAEDYSNEAYRIGYISALSLIESIVSDTDPIEAEPVRHGRWIHDINNLYGCSECMERETMSPKRLKNYCPNCGAKMDAKEDTNA